MKQIPRFLVAVLMTLAVVLAGVTPDTARAEGPDDSVPPPGVFTAQASDLSADAQELLKENGVKGPDLTIEQREGLVLVTDGEAWIVSETSTDIHTQGVGTLDIEVGGCVGNFYGPWTVSGTVEWGGENTCANTGPNDVYVHSIGVSLNRKRLVFTWDRIAGVLSPQEQQYSMVASAHRSLSCDNSDLRTYRLTATITVKSVVFPTVNSLERLLHCDFD